MNQSYARNRRLMWVLFVALVVLHHDWWFWTDGRLLFDFLPVGLAYHMLISLAAGALWGWAAWRAWPEEFEDSPPAAALTVEASHRGNGLRRPSHVSGLIQPGS
jgi:hypothetical protein